MKPRKLSKNFWRRAHFNLEYGQNAPPFRGGVLLYLLIFSLCVRNRLAVASDIILKKQAARYATESRYRLCLRYGVVPLTRNNSLKRGGTEYLVFHFSVHLTLHNNPALIPFLMALKTRSLLSGRTVSVLSHQFFSVRYVCMRPHGFWTTWAH